MRLTINKRDRDLFFDDWELDLHDAKQVFAGVTATREAPGDPKKDQGFETIGRLEGRMACVVWTLQRNARKVIAIHVQRPDSTWAGPGDPPQWNSLDFDTAEYRIGDKIATRAEAIAAAGGRGAKAAKRTRGKGKKAAKVMTTLRIPQDVLARWKGTGPGWQTRMVARLSEP